MANDKKDNVTNSNELVQYIVNIGKKMVKNEFAKFSAIMAVIFTCGLWIIKGFWYMYWSGKFYVYNIDKCYIRADNESVILQIMQMASVLIVWFFVSYIYYKISLAEDTSKFAWKRKGRKLLFWLVEMLIVFLMILFLNNISIIDLIVDCTLVGWGIIIILLFLTCLLINMFAIEFIMFAHLEKREIEKTKCESKKQNDKIKKKTINEMNIKEKLKIVCYWFMITVAIEMVFAYCFGIYQEHNRREYKIIVREAVGTEESKFQFQFDDVEGTYVIFPIVHENTDYYIVSRLYSKNKEIVIDYEYQRIIDKEEQETLYIENIDNIDIN